MLNQIWKNLSEAKLARKKSFAVLLDPDFSDIAHLANIVSLANNHRVDYFFVGGSLLTRPHALAQTLAYVKANSTIPTIIFPGSYNHIDSNADAILLLSLISGRNPDFLIGNHVLAAPTLRESQIEILPTGYMLIDGGKPTTVSYVSNTTPLPSNKPSIAACTAMAGEMLGLKLIFLDAGSGAESSVAPSIIKAVADVVSCPIIVGGGIRTSAEAIEKLNAGADLIVIGNAIEQNPNLLGEVARALQ